MVYLLEFVATALASVIAGCQWGTWTGIMVFCIIYVLYQPNKR